MKLIKNLEARNDIINSALRFGCYTGQSRGGRYWNKINRGQMYIGYAPDTDMTYYYGFEGVLVHEARGNPHAFGE